MGGQVIEGNLEEIPLATILRELYLKRVSGIIDLYRDHEHRRIVLDDGEVRTARSNRMEQRIGQFAVKSEAISRIQLMQAISEKDHGAPFGQRLVRMGFMTEETLRSQLQGLAREIIVECIGWDSGMYRFQQGRASMVPENEIRMSTADIIYRGFRTHASEQLARKTIGDLNMPLTQNPNLRLLFQHISLSDEEQRVLGMIDGTAPASQLVVTIPGEAAENLQILGSLVAAGLIVTTDKLAELERVVVPIADDTPTAPAEDSAPEKESQPDDELAPVKQTAARGKGPLRPPRRRATTGPPRRAATTPGRRVATTPEDEQTASTPGRRAARALSTRPPQRKPTARAAPKVSARPSSSRIPINADETEKMRARIMRKFAVLRTGDPYRLLGVAKNATQREIYYAFNTLCSLFHPDLALHQPFADLKQQLESIFCELEQAYETLGKLENRERYDKEHSW